MKKITAKTKTMYQIVFWAFVTFTCICYVWTIYSFLLWIIKLIFKL